MRKYSLVLIGVALAVAIAACTDVPAPRGQEGSIGDRDVITPEPVPTDIEKGVVPDLFHVQIEEAGKVVKKAGFTPEFDSLALAFVEGADLPEEDVVCEQEPEAGATPPDGSTVVLTFDDKC